MESYIFNAHNEPICKRLYILKLPDLYNLQLHVLQNQTRSCPSILNYFYTPNNAAIVDRPSVRPKRKMMSVVRAYVGDVLDGG